MGDRRRRCSAQLWVFWVAPIAGGALGAVAWRLLGEGAIRKRVARLPVEEPV